MSNLGNNIKSADWKTEKHVPVIECPTSFKSDTAFSITVSVGKEVKHPNTTEHFISWIELWFKPSSGGPLVQLGRSEFTAHGESAAGANQGAAYTEPQWTGKIQLKTAGTLIATAYCNIHGLWETSQEIVLA